MANRLSALALLAVIKLTIGLTLNCSYENYRSVYMASYACVTQNLHTTLRDRTITEVSGIHMAGKTHRDVEKVFVKHQNCAHLPLNLGQFFPNLKILYVMKSNVQYLIDGDLDGLDNLEIFDVSHNPVEQVSANFFSGHASLKIISFYDCHIKKVEFGALNPLTNIERMHFEGNVCLDQRFDADSSSLEEVCENIYDSCHGKDYTFRTKQAEGCDSELKHSHAAGVKGEPVADISSSWSVVLSILLALTTLANIVFVIALYRIFKSNFGSNWQEMRNVLV